jgi:hypothetical protein
LFKTSTDTEVASTTSDVNGNYGFFLTGFLITDFFYIVAYKAGATDVAGTTVNTLVLS